VLLLRRLCPRFLYPGRARVGATEGVLSFPADVPVCNGLDWFWGLSALRAWRFYRRTRPAAVVLQWWTGTVLHSYLALAWLAKSCGARLVVEFHEVQDIGEAAVPLAAQYARTGMRLLLRSVDAVVVHSEADRQAVRRAYPRAAGLPVAVIPHGPYAQYAIGEDPRGQAASSSRGVADAPVRLLTFGVVRPYKGHTELAEAARLLVESGTDVHVTVVGEVWQGYQEPLDRLAAVLPPDRLRVVDRYVADEEVSGFFAAADVVVLPYHRSSASGPLHIAMSCGLPVVTTAVGGLIEATAGYTGAVLVPPRDAVALARGIREALPLVGTRHLDPHSWSSTVDRFAGLLGLDSAVPAGDAVREPAHDRGLPSQGTKR
jgi:glycosyltransferase involved in cell wall biosynthesis